MQLAVDPLHLCIFLIPLAVYLLLMGSIHVSGRSFVTTGVRDTASLGFAVIGFAIGGPMKLFLPQSAANVFGPYVWLMMIALYLLVLSLILLFTRPRIVVYNISTPQLRTLLKSIATELDPASTWASDSLSMPNFHIHLYIEPAIGRRCCQLIATGPHQRLASWQQLEQTLSKSLANQKAPRSAYGMAILGVAVFIFTAVSLSMYADPAAVTAQWSELLRP